MSPLADAPALPLGTSGPYVAAAYIVVLAVILLYVAIMAVRAQRLETELDRLRRDVEAARAGSGDASPSLQDESEDRPREPIA
jgi:CcmD family protein